MDREKVSTVVTVYGVLLYWSSIAHGLIICYQNTIYDDGAISSRSVLWPCERDTDCSSKVTNTTCSIYSYCHCPAGHVFSADVTRCLPESAYGVACEEAVQCSHMLTGAKCDAGLCTCDSDYTYVRGRCRQLVDLGGQCTEDIDCFFSHNREAVICRQGKCDCADGFYQRSSNVCRRRVYNEGEACVVNEDCTPDGLVCRDKVCTADAAAQTKTFRDAGVQATDEKGPSAEGRPVWPASKDAATNTDGGRPGRRVQIRSRKDDCEGCPKFGDDCIEEGVECPGVPYSVCRIGQCHCKEGYYHANGLCMAELGETAHDSQYCDQENTFRDYRCTCPDDMVYDNNMRVCLKSVLGIETSCTQQNQCTAYGEAYCPSVSPKRCRCHPYAQYNEETELCEPKKGYEQYCQTDADCPLDNALCSGDRTCVCRSNYFYVNERCKAGKGGPCDTEDDCGFEGSVCESDSAEVPQKRCNCGKGHIYHEERCLKSAEQYGDSCSVQEQCQPLLGELGKCVDAKCTCNENEDHYKDGKCNEKRALDERCSKSSECFVEDGASNVECRNSACQCKFDYSPDVERQKCIRPSGKNSSGRPSALKVITLLLTSAAVLITGSALRDAYYGY